MSKPYDATTKHLLETYPQDWLTYLGLLGLKAQLIETDVSTVTAYADKVIQVKDTPPWLLNIEFLSWADPEAAEQGLDYSVLLTRKHGLMVYTVIVQLCRRAAHRRTTGYLERTLHGRPYLTFAYEIIRAWERPVEEVLAGGLGTLPLAPLANVKRKALPGVIEIMKGRIEQETTPQLGAELWTATKVLMGLSYPPPFVEQLLQGVRKMKGSATYQAILEEGRDEGRTEGRILAAQEILRHKGEKRLGPPSEQMIRRLSTITSFQELERLIDRTDEIESWQELLSER